MKRISILHNQKGSSMVLTAILLVAIMGFASIAVDIGLVAFEKAKVARAADSAALAGAQELLNNEENAERVAKEYLQKNGVNPSDVDIEIFGNSNGMKISIQKEVDYFFARALGFDTGKVYANAAAKSIPVTSVHQGIRPFAIEVQTFHFGQLYILKEPGGSGSNGNYGALALGGTGASNYKHNILYGYDSTLNVGDLVDTETGNMSDPTMTGVEALIRSCPHSPPCTFDHYHPDCPRIVTVVIVDSLDVNGRKPVKIKGFASFFLEGVAGHGNKSEVTGRFIKTLSDGNLSESQVDYGLRSLRLIE